MEYMVTVFNQSLIDNTIVTVAKSFALDGDRDQCVYNGGCIFPCLKLIIYIYKLKNNLTIVKIYY